MMQKSPIILGVLLLLTAPFLAIIASPIAFADVDSGEHGGGSMCYNCHVATYPGGNPEDLHGMQSNQAWSNCADCHVGLANDLQSSVHSALDCRGCHAPLHVSLNEAGAGAWMFVNRLNNSGEIAYKPSLPVEFQREVLYFDNTNDTSNLGQTIANWGGEIHWAWTNASGSPAGISSSTRYLVCMNCHFLTTNPAEAGLARLIDGNKMIAVPEFSLRLTPHTITDSALREANSGNGQLVSFKSNEVRTLSGIIAGIGIIGLVLWRKRPNI